MKLPSLTDLCANRICDIIMDHIGQALEEELDEPPFKSRTRSKFGTLKFHDHIFLPESISEKIITILSSRGLLNDYTMSLFDAKHTRLRHLKIVDASMLQENWCSRNLKILKHHNLLKLEVHKLNLPVNILVESLGKWTLNNLETLNISESSLTDHYKVYRVMDLAKLKNLAELDVSYSEFNSHNLKLIVEDLPRLESLNISETRVDNIMPLRKTRKRLKKLFMANLKLFPPSKKDSSFESFDDLIFSLNELRHLDVSFDRANAPFDMLMTTESRHVFKIIESPEKLLHLVSLDISGQDDICDGSLVPFLRHHPNLQFIGLVFLEACNNKILTNPSDADYRSDLKVTGTGSVDQVILAMKLYQKRYAYIQRCLYSLYSFSDHDRLGARPDIIKLVTKLMKLHHTTYTIQLACTACLYNLTKSGWIDSNGFDSIPQILMSKVVSLTLDAMERFPAQFQLQKNALLTLCNDKILQETKMDRFRCARLVLNTFCQFNYEDIDRLCVAISSVVASKISSQETTEIGSQPRYMKKLLAIVTRKLRELAVDATLSFALSTLWNLSDESPPTCSVFLDEGGMDLFTEMLRQYMDNESVLTKILGLLNNIAEVHCLRFSLMRKEIINSIRSLLKSESIEISYFSAGVFAHLVSNGADDWSVDEIPRSLVLKELEEAVLRWERADKEMVAYRSFRPFLPLLQCYQTYQAQLWALWAIQHVLTAHALRYFEMLTAEGICDILNELTRSSHSNELVRRRASIILAQLHDFAEKKILTFTF